jgi:hypothetical protein
MAHGANKDNGLDKTRKDDKPGFTPTRREPQLLEVTPPDPGSTLALRVRV